MCAHCITGYFFLFMNGNWMLLPLRVHSEFMHGTCIYIVYTIMNVSRSSFLLQCSFLPKFQIQIDSTYIDDSGKTHNVSIITPFSKAMCSRLSFLQVYALVHVHVYLYTHSPMLVMCSHVYFRLSHKHAMQSVWTCTRNRKDQVPSLFA